MTEFVCQCGAEASGLLVHAVGCPVNLKPRPVCLRCGKERGAHADPQGKAWCHMLAEYVFEPVPSVPPPALHWLLFAPRPYGGGVGNLERPPECCHCPFATPDPNEEPPNPSDPGEGHYRCGLLGDEEVSKRNVQTGYWAYHQHTVWGENPKCTGNDWLVRAREEFTSLKVTP